MGVTAAFSQAEKNYILEMNGDTIHLSLGESATMRLKNGQTIPVKLTKKEMSSYKNDFVSFSYPSEYSVSTTKLDEDINQILLMSATGNGIMVQTYSTINPDMVVDIMLKQITEDDIAAGYKGTTSPITKTLNDGMVLKGKKAVLTMDKDREEFTVMAYGVRKMGIVIVEIHNDFENADSEKIFKTFWGSLKVLFH